MEFFITGVSRLLMNPIEASKVYLPGSSKSVNLTSELLLLVWFTFQTNRKLYECWCESEDVLIVLQALINESLDARVEPCDYSLKLAKLGSLRISCFLLQILSQDRNFAIQMNTQVDLSILGSYAKQLPQYSTGCWGDIVFLVVFLLIFSLCLSCYQHQHLLEAQFCIFKNLTSPLWQTWHL
jgi:hypothetical protein